MIGRPESANGASDQAFPNKEWALLQLNKFSDYGVVLMAYLAREGERAPHNAREMSETLQLPLPTVSKILKHLARAGLLESQRGWKGGYELARKPAKISVVDIVSALEGPLGLTECTSSPGNCSRESQCAVRTPWQRINSAIQDALSRVTLAELIDPTPALPHVDAAALAPPEPAREIDHG